MTDNVAILDGYTVEAWLDTGFTDFPILVKPDTDLDSRFKAFDTDNQEYIMVNGWTVTIKSTK